MDWKLWAERGKVAYEKYKQGKKAYQSAKKASEYLKLVIHSFDEDERSASLFKLGIKATMDAASKLLGTSLTSHPYFRYHKIHLDALAGALKVSDTKANADAALESAIKASDSAQQLAGQVGSYESRRSLLAQRFAMINLFVLAVARDLRNNVPQAFEQVRSANNTPEGVQREAEQQIYEYRCCWAALTDGVLELLLMVKADLVATTQAMDQYNTKVKKLETGKGMVGNLGRIASASMAQQRMLQALEAGPRRERTIMDPVAPARQAFDRLSKLATIICRSNDAVFDDAMVYGDPRKLIAVLSTKL